MSIFTKISKLNIEKKIMFLIVAISIVLLTVYMFNGFDRSEIDVSFYSLRTRKVDEKVRVVCIADLHLREFGEGNEDLIARIEALSPDIIAAPGDFITRKKKDYHVAFELLEKLNKIAPVYFSYGNHEYGDILFNKKSTLRKDIANTGVNVVNNSSVVADVKGNKIAIGGFCVGPKNFKDSNPEKFVKKFCEREEFKLLLCHHVECFEDVMNDYPVDLAFTGHAHGGQVILPFLGALYSPDQGFFPDLTEGMHYLCGSNVIITRGLGNSSPVVRFNNNPEIVVADITNY